MECACDFFSTERKQLFKEMRDKTLNIPSIGYSHRRSSSASEFRESDFQGKELFYVVKDKICNLSYGFLNSTK